MISYRQADLLEGYVETFHGIMKLERHHIDIDFVWQVVSPSWATTPRVKAELRSIFTEVGFVEYHGIWQYEMNSQQEEDSEIYEMLLATMKNHGMEIIYQKIEPGKISIEYKAIP